MNLQIRNPRAYELAKKLAEAENVSMTDAVIGALEAKLTSAQSRESLWERIQPIIQDVKKASKPGGRDMTKDEIDAMWEHD